MSASPKRSSIQASLRARDAGFTKIATTTRVLVAGAIAATGLFTVLAARAQPGRAKATTSNAAGQGAASSPATGLGGIGAGSGSDTNLSPPTTLPAPDYQYSNPVVVSGAS
jgi:hypothetical protein